MRDGLIMIDDLKMGDEIRTKDEKRSGVQTLYQVKMRS